MSTYENDFYSWTIEQANLLKAGKFDSIDLINIVEEILSMGKSEKRELESHLTILIQHLLKWQYQPERQSRSWELTIDEQRERFKETLTDNPGLKPKLDEILLRAYKYGVIEEAKETGQAKNFFPAACPWTLENILDDSFFPA